MDCRFIQWCLLNLAFTQCTNSSNACIGASSYKPSVHPTILFSSLFFLGLDPQNTYYILILAYGIFASMGPGNAYKDMLNNTVITLVMLSWITKIKLEHMTYEACSLQKAAGPFSRSARFSITEEGGHEMGQNGPRPVGPSRPAWPISWPIRAHFDLAASRTIYSPLAKSHTSIHSSSATEEQTS
jgi:hypothetical protein